MSKKLTGTRLNLSVIEYGQPFKNLWYVITLFFFNDEVCLQMFLSADCQGNELKILITDNYIGSWYRSK